MFGFVPKEAFAGSITILFSSLKNLLLKVSHCLLVETYGKYALSETTCKDWFRRFKDNDYDVKDKERPGQPKKFKDGELEALLEEDSCQTLKELSEIKENLNLKRALMDKRSQYAKRHDKLILLHDNARPHIAKSVKGELIQALIIKILLR